LRPSERQHSHTVESSLRVVTFQNLGTDARGEPTVGLQYQGSHCPRVGDEAVSLAARSRVIFEISISHSLEWD